MHGVLLDNNMDWADYNAMEPNVKHTFLKQVLADDRDSRQANKAAKKEAKQSAKLDRISTGARRDNTRNFFSNVFGGISDMGKELGGGILSAATGLPIGTSMN